MWKNTIFTILALVVLSCGNDKKTKNQADAQQTAVSEIAKKDTTDLLLTDNKSTPLGESDSRRISGAYTPNASSTITTIKFNDLLVTINGMAIFDAEKMNDIQQDTAEIEAEVGESLEGRLISISSEELTSLTVEQRYETSITIMNEGPHCDLIDWEHFNSDWKWLKENSNRQFIADEYSEQDYNHFPAVSMDELKQTVKEQCGEEWFKLLAKTNSPYEYPCAVNISRYFLRITGKRINNGQKVTKLIIIKTSMGC